MSVLGNDIDPVAAGLTIVSTTPPTSGSVVILSNGTIRYSPSTGFRGTDVFTSTFRSTPQTPGVYTFVVRTCDSRGACTESSVTITVQTGNRIPTTGSSSGSTLQLALASLLAGVILVLAARRRDRDRLTG